MFKIDIIEIMMIDCVYEEYGLDREAIKAAIKKHDIKNDKEFKDMIRNSKKYETILI